MNREDAYTKFCKSFEQAFKDWWMTQSKVTVLSNSQECELAQLNARHQPYIEEYRVDDEEDVFVEALIGLVLHDGMPKVNGKMYSYIRRSEGTDSRISIKWSIKEKDWVCTVEDDGINVKINKVMLAA